MILNRSGDNFGSAGAVLVDEDDERILWISVSCLRAEVLNGFPGLAAGLQDEFVLLQECFADFDSFLEQSTRVSPKIQNQPFQLRGIHLSQCFLKFLAGRFGETVDL